MLLLLLGPWHILAPYYSSSTNQTGISFHILHHLGLVREHPRMQNTSYVLAAVQASCRSDEGRTCDLKRNDVQLCRGAQHLVNGQQAVGQ